MKAKRNFTLEIILENDAFHPDPAPELANILGRLSQQIGCDGILMAGIENDLGASAGIWDRQGNWCGHWKALLASNQTQPD